MGAGGSVAKSSKTNRKSDKAAPTPPSFTNSLPRRARHDKLRASVLQNTPQDNFTKQSPVSQGVTNSPSSASASLEPQREMRESKAAVSSLRASPESDSLTPKNPPSQEHARPQNTQHTRPPHRTVVSPGASQSQKSGQLSPSLEGCSGSPLDIDEAHDQDAHAESNNSDLSAGLYNGRALLPEPDLQESTRSVQLSADAARLSALRRQVQPTWMWAVERGNIPAAGAEVYNKMLSMHPNLAAFFGGIFIADQGMALMDMLHTAIDPNDHRRAIDSVELLIGAGVRHRGYGVTEETLPALRDAFMSVFPRFTDRKMFMEAQLAWVEFFDFIITLLRRGAQSPEGDRLGRMYRKQMTKILAKDWHLIEDRQDRDTNHKFITFMCQKGFLLKPSLMSFEALFDIRVGKRIFDTITAIVDHLDEVNVVEEYLAGMGVNHDSWNITYNDFLIFTNPFLETCEYYLSDVWTVAMETRFARLFQFLIDGMARGMASAQSSSGMISARI